MNILFVVPRDQSCGFLTIPPGIVYVATAAKEAGHHVVGIHLNYEFGDDKQLLQQTIERHKIALVCTGGLSDQYLEVRRIISIVREIDSAIPTVIGGGLVSTEPEIALTGTGATIGVIGQGEHTICELVAALDGNGPLNAVNGVVFRSPGDNKKLIRTVARDDEINIDSFAFPDYSLFDYSEVPVKPEKIIGNIEKRTINITASRSCPYLCTFCYHPSGSHYRRRSLDNLFEELDLLVETYDVEHINVIDELFAKTSERVEEFCRRIEPYQLTFSIQLRVDAVTLPMLQELKRCGCTTVGYGLESADNRILKSMRKRITIEQIENALRMTRDAHLFVQGCFIFGDTEENQESVNTTLSWWARHLEYGINLAMIRVFPGTELYKRAIETGIIADRKAFLEEGCPYINVSKLSNQEMAGLHKKITYLNEFFVGVTRGIEIERITDEQQYDLVAECMDCGHKTRFSAIPFEYRNNINAARATCERCLQKLRIHPSSAISPPTYKTVVDYLAESYFAPYAKQNKKIAIWGVTEKSRLLLMSSKSLRDQVVAVVDRDYLLKEERLFDRFPVLPPETLCHTQFDYLVIGAVGYESQIQNSLNKMGVETAVLDI